MAHYARLFIAGLMALTASAMAGPRNAGDACSAIGPYYWEIGDRSGALASGSVNSTASEAYDAGTAVDIASASKWLYAAFVAQSRTLTAADLKLLQLRGGYDDFGACSRFQTVGKCADAGTNGVYTASADGKFYYGGGHMQHLAAMTGLGAYDPAGLGNAVSSVLGVSVEYRTPQLAGGATVTPAAYAAFLRALMTGSLVLGPMLGSNPVCTNPQTCPTALNSPIPSTESWHYSLGHWIEDDPVVGDGSFSNVGAFGFYAWIAADKQRYGIVAQHSLVGGWASVQCGRQIRKQWR